MTRETILAVWNATLFQRNLNVQWDAKIPGIVSFKVWPAPDNEQLCEFALALEPHVEASLVVIINDQSIGYWAAMPLRSKPEGVPGNTCTRCGDSYEYAKPVCNFVCTSCRSYAEMYA